MEKAEKHNLYIKSIIESNSPFFIGRIAGCELKVAHSFLSNTILNNELMELENNAGIKVSDNTSLKLYVKNLLQAYEHCTVIAEWDIKGKVFAHTGIGQQLITDKTPTIPKIDARALEPYYFSNSWMPSLKGKKILVVHPFASTFMKQIKNMEKIFPNRCWFEECEFIFVRPPLTLAGNHKGKDWQEHFQECIEDLRKNSNFDIALVAAGGYGMLIADFIFSELNKSVMYIGGALQLFFGVIGKRWFDNKEVLTLVNDDWIRPLKDDKPDNFTRVEKGCYW